MSVDHLLVHTRALLADNYYERVVYSRRRLSLTNLFDRIYDDRRYESGGVWRVEDGYGVAEHFEHHTKMSCRTCKFRARLW